VLAFAPAQSSTKPPHSGGFTEEKTTKQTNLPGKMIKSKMIFSLCFLCLLVAVF
jgi:hypothetical protein